MSSIRRNLITTSGPSIFLHVSCAKIVFPCRFGPNETEYIVKGFYRDSETSYPFTFDSTKSDLPISCDNEDDTNISHYYIEAANSVGAVRIQFAKVKKWLHRKKTDSVACLDAKKRRLNGESALACLADAKGVHVAARPADMHTCDGQSTTVDMEAVLSPEVLFECRLFYNDFAGYRKQASVGSAMSSHYQCHYG